MTLDVARDLWAARYGYEWRAYISQYTPTGAVEIDVEDPFWSVVMYKLRDAGLLEFNFPAGQMRLSQWK